MSKHKGVLQLDGLTELSDAVAESLSKHKHLTLYGLKTVNDSPAHLALLNRLCKSDYLSLPNLVEISGATAKTLAKQNGVLELDGLKELSDSAAESLGQHHGKRLRLNNLRGLSDATAEFLSEYRGELWLTSVKHLSDSVAKVLSNHKGTLVLDGLPNLSDTAARALANLNLHGLRVRKQFKLDIRLDKLPESACEIFINAWTE